MKFTLKWSGRENSEINALAFEYCKNTIPICKDVCEFIDHDRYLQLIAAEEIAGPTKYMSIDQFQIGMICYSHAADSYSRSWEDLEHCYKDFVAGYEACNKKLKLYLDWDEAIKHEKERSEFLSLKQRKIVVDFTDYMRDNCIDTFEMCKLLEEQFTEVTYCRCRLTRSASIITIHLKATGPQVNDITLTLWRQYDVQCQPLDDPRLCEHRQQFTYDTFPTMIIKKKSRKEK